MPALRLLLLEEVIEPGFGCADAARGVFGNAVLEREESTEVRLFPIRDVLRDVLLALVVRGRVPVLAVLAAVHVDAAVRARIGALELHIEDDLVLALVAEMPLFLDLRNPAHDLTKPPTPLDVAHHALILDLPGP